MGMVSESLRCISLVSVHCSTVPRKLFGFAQNQQASSCYDDHIHGDHLPTVLSNG
jgi:hypothetical protein